MSQEYEGVPTRSLLGAFFAVVLLCAVFFSLGFFLGYRQGHPGNALSTEQVQPSSDIPQEVNPPASGPQPSAESQASPATKPASDQNAPDGSTGATASATPAASPGSSSSAPRGAHAGGLSTEAASPPSSTAARSSPPAPTAVSQGSAAIVPARVPSGLLVQVAALSNQQDAVNMATVLKSRGYPALILTPQQAKADDAFFRVVVGPYKTQGEADRARALLAAGGFKPFVRQ